MTLEDEVKQLMYLRDKIKEYRKAEKSTINSIIQYLKNHNQEGVIFKHNNQQITLMVESTNIKKSISKKDREKKVKDILYNVGIKDVSGTTKDIINGMKSLVMLDNQLKDKLKIKMK